MLAMVNKSDSSIKPDASESTDGFHLVVEALKLNQINKIYGVVGIPITDLAQLAQANASAISASAMSNPQAMPRRAPVT